MPALRISTAYVNHRAWSGRFTVPFGKFRYERIRKPSLPGLESLWLSVWNIAVNAESVRVGNKTYNFVIVCAK